MEVTFLTPPLMLLSPFKLIPLLLLVAPIFSAVRDFAFHPQQLYILLLSFFLFDLTDLLVGPCPYAGAELALPAPDDHLCFDMYS